MDFETDVLTSHVCLSEHMPSIVTKMYKDLGIEINSEEIAKNTTEAFSKTLEGQNPSQCLLILLYMLREVYRQMQNEKVVEGELTPEFLKLIGKRKESPMYG